MSKKKKKKKRCICDAFRQFFVFPAAVQLESVKERRNVSNLINSPIQCTISYLKIAMQKFFIQISVARESYHWFVVFLW